MFWNKYKVYIIFTILVIIMISGVVFWNNIIDKKDNNEVKDTIDVSDANNVPYVDAKLGSDVRITQGYLLNYVTKKSSIWYMSTGYVKKITKKDKEATINLSETKDSETYIQGTIEIDKCNIKTGDLVNFVGTIDIESGTINLSKISKETINYQNMEEIDFNSLEDNLNLIKSTYFIISGYMVTDDKEYKLYDTKEAWQNDNSDLNYFTIEWKETFNYTGNQDIKIKCLLSNTHKLKECEMQ